MSAITSEWLLKIAQEAAVRPARDDGSHSPPKRSVHALPGRKTGP
jgi:hypothetical protein